MPESNTPTYYDFLGGADGVLGFVDRFYFYMDILPEAREIRLMHAENLQSAKSKLFKFLSGWLGGPNLYIEEYGHPMLRARHLPFAIGKAEADQWLLCAHKALNELAIDTNVRENVYMALENVALHMINR